MFFGLRDHIDTHTHTQTGRARVRVRMWGGPNPFRFTE